MNKGQVYRIISEDRDEYKELEHRLIMVTEIRNENGNIWVHGETNLGDKWYGYPFRLSPVIIDTEFYQKYTTEHNKVIIAAHADTEDFGTERYDDMAPFGGCMYETYGEELAHVLKEQETRHNHIWTIIEDAGELFICAGYRLVDRCGYLITDQPWINDNEEYACY